MAAGPPVVRRRESRRFSKYQGRRFSEILLEKPRAPLEKFRNLFGKIPDSLWTESLIRLEKSQTHLRKNLDFRIPQMANAAGAFRPQKLI